jgi:hypothetical protein
VHLCTVSAQFVTMPGQLQHCGPVSNLYACKHMCHLIMLEPLLAVFIGAGTATLLALCRTMPCG